MIPHVDSKPHVCPPIVNRRSPTEDTKGKFVIVSRTLLPSSDFVLAASVAVAGNKLLTAGG